MVDIGEVTTPQSAYNGTVPLNVTRKAIVFTAVTVSASTPSPTNGLALNSSTKSILIIPSITPTAPIFVNFGEGANVNASASVADRVLAEGYISLQEGAWGDTTHLSFFSTLAQTVYVIQLP